MNEALTIVLICLSVLTIATQIFSKVFLKKWTNGHAKQALSYVVLAGGFGVCFVFGIALLGYIVNQPMLYTFPHGHTAVALPTSLGFIILGMCVCILAKEGTKP